MARIFFVTVLARALGSFDSTFLILCSWHRWITGWSKTAFTALVRALAPSMTTRIGLVTSRPRSAKPDEEVLDDGGVLGVALCDRERVLLAGYVDPHRHDTDVIAEVHAVDHERHEVELGELTRQQLGQGVLGGLDKAS